VLEHPSGRFVIKAQRVFAFQFTAPCLISQDEQDITSNSRARNGRAGSVCRFEHVDWSQLGGRVLPSLPSPVTPWATATL
jgi:hypothetical protein